MKVMEQSEERLSRINAYNKLVDAAILTKTSSKSVADIVNHELGIECTHYFGIYNREAYRRF